MSEQPPERRAFQRLELTRPIFAKLGSKSALILDIGLTGALVEHDGEIELRAPFTFTFEWQGEKIELVCEPVRSTLARYVDAAHQHAIHHSGVQFTAGIDQSFEKLRRLITTEVTAVIAAQRFNALGRSPFAADILSSLGSARRGRDRSFLRYELVPGAWLKKRVFSNAQPEMGFTVGGFEDEVGLDALCKAYEDAGPEERRLIRLMAELSVSDGVPPVSPA